MKIMKNINNHHDKNITNSECNLMNIIQISTITRPYRDFAFQSNWKNTIWNINENNYNIQLPKLWIFNENEWDVNHKRDPLMKNDLPRIDCFTDIFSVQHVALTEANVFIDEFYNMPKTLGLHSIIMDGKVLLRKIKRREIEKS
jgi:hypothetical protein